MTCVFSLLEFDIRGNLLRTIHQGEYVKQEKENQWEGVGTPCRPSELLRASEAP